MKMNLPDDIWKYEIVTRIDDPQSILALQLTCREAIQSIVSFLPHIHCCCSVDKYIAKTKTKKWCPEVKVRTLEWMHSHGRMPDCTVVAMNIAADMGDFDIVEWLHRTRTEGCTTDAMNGAAGNGHLHVVEWLHHNRTE